LEKFFFKSQSLFQNSNFVANHNVVGPRINKTTEEHNLLISQYCIELPRSSTNPFYLYPGIIKLMY
jgi:hypothetical protein